MHSESNRESATIDTTSMGKILPGRFAELELLVNEEIEGADEPLVAFLNICLEEIVKAGAISLFHSVKESKQTKLECRIDLSEMSALENFTQLVDTMLTGTDACLAAMYMITGEARISKKKQNPLVFGYNLAMQRTIDFKVH